MESTKINEKYTLKKAPIGIDGTTLELYNVELDSIVEDLLNEDDIPEGTFPLWIKIWEASVVLAAHLLEHQNRLNDRTILEIGAGMGLSGLFLGARGFDVTITDYDEDALALLRLNANINGLEDHIRVDKLDFFQPRTAERYDIICGSELIYKEEFFRPLLFLFDDLLTPQGTVYLSHDVRRGPLKHFIQLAKERFDVETLVKTLKGSDRYHKIVIHQLKRQ